MQHVNRAEILGEVCDTIQLRELASGTVVGTLGVKTERTFTKKGGESGKAVAFHKVTLWGDHARDSEGLSEGDVVSLTGEIKYSKYENKEGITVHKTEINVSPSDRVVLFPSGAVESVNNENPFD